MSAIHTKSLTGITSITTPSGIDNVFTVHSNDTTERFRVDLNGNQSIAGILTVSQDLDVDGHTNLDNTDIVGILTVTSTTQYGGYKLSNNSSIVGELVGLSGSNDTGALALWSGGSKYVQLSAIGNSYLTGGSLGIGTNNIDSPLEVVGTGPSLVTIHHGDGSTNDEARIMLGALPNNPPDNRGAGIAAVNNGAGHDLIIKCSTNHSLSPSEKVRITSGGRLLIATTTEGHSNADDLTIATAAGSLGNTGITIRSSTTGDGNIFFSDATSGDGETKGVIKYAHNTDHMQFNTAGSERLRITAGGQVRIANTDLTTSASADDLIVGTTSGNRGLTIFSGTSNTGNIYFGDTDTSGLGNRMGTISYYHNENYMRFSTNGNQERLRITSGGNVRVTSGVIENSNTISSNYTVSTNFNAMSAGPMSIANGVSVTVPSGSAWTIV